MGSEFLRPVALVDDELAVRDSLKFLLELEGFTVRAYGTPHAFLEERAAANPACLVLDQNMPGMTGLQLVDRLRTECSELPVILVTAQPSPAVVSMADDLGVAKVLEKPPDEGELLKFLRLHCSTNKMPLRSEPPLLLP